MKITEAVTFPFKWLFNLNSDKRTAFATNLSETESDRYKATLNENASLKAQIGRILAEKRAEMEEEKEKDVEKSVISDLNEQNRKINKDRFGEVISLSKFFYALSTDKKFRNSIEVTDKDDKEVFGKFGDMLFSTKTGWLLITDSYGNPLAYGDRISNVIYKPETFGNQIRRGRILLPRDKDFNPVVDLESIEIPDVVYDEPTNTWKETEEYRAKVKDLLIKRDIQNRKDKNYIERLELAQTNQRREIVDLKRTLETYKNLKNTTESELSLAMSSTLQLTSKLGDLQRKITNLTELKAMHESQLSAFQNIVEKLLEKIEQGGDKGQYETIKEEVFADLERAKTLLPEVVQVTEAKQEPEPKVPNPGEVIGQRR